jgi:hypothetical protein
VGKINSKKIFVVIIHAFIVWVLCGLTIGIGRSIGTMQTTLKIHVIGAPIFAALVPVLYYKRYKFTNIGSKPSGGGKYFLVGSSRAKKFLDITHHKSIQIILFLGYPSIQYVNKAEDIAPHISFK